MYNNQFIFLLFFLPYGTILRELILCQVFHNSAADFVGMVRCKLSHLLCYYVIILRTAKKCERRVNWVSSILIYIVCWNLIRCIESKIYTRAISKEMHRTQYLQSRTPDVRKSVIVLHCSPPSAE